MHYGEATLLPFGSTSIGRKLHFGTTREERQEEAVPPLMQKADQAPQVAEATKFTSQNSG